MADQIFSAECGFFDAVSYDRLYSASDMNRPYNRLVSDGVFATPSGTASDDLQVVSAGSGMNIIVKSGQGLFAGKWFQLPGDLTIAVPSADTLPRKDSVLVQIDKRESGRAGYIVYRTGTPANDPSAPAINQVTDVIEYRLANIDVAAAAQSISAADITDKRGSSECPWVTSLIQQVDTSTLFDQYLSAYARQYASYAEDYEEYKEQQQTDWEAFIQSLTEELTVTTNVLALRSSYTATGTVTTVPIGITGFNPSTDVLQVYINGLYAAEGDKYTVDSGATTITLTTAIAAGDVVSFICLKNVITGDLATVQTLIQQMQTQLTDATTDTGWIDLTLQNGAEAYSAGEKPQIRAIGNQVFVRGAFKGSLSDKQIAVVPVEMIPDMDHYYASMGTYSGNKTVVQMKIAAVTGAMTIESTSLTSIEHRPIDTSYIANIGASPYQNADTMEF